MEFEIQLEREVRKVEVLEEIARLNIEIWTHTNAVVYHQSIVENLEDQINKLKTELRDE